jgi:hypothetical protein
MAVIERWAEWYLERRGRVVLPRIFIGIAFGHCVAIKTGGDRDYDHWSVVAPKTGKVYALTNSVIDMMQRKT